MTLYNNSPTSQKKKKKKKKKRNKKKKKPTKPPRPISIGEVKLKPKKKIAAAP